jgi:hypothetical protein
MNKKLHLLHYLALVSSRGDQIFLPSDWRRDGQGACGMRARRLGFGSILSAAAIVGDAVEDVEISAEVSFWCEFGIKLRRPRLEMCLLLFHTEDDRYKILFIRI